MNIYEQFDVQPIINASGPVTRLGGAPMPDAVLKAFHEAASQAVSLEQLQAAASKRIAAATGAEAGLVTAGAAAALTLGAAAIMTEFDLSRMEKLPHTGDFPNEFIIAREQRSGYDHAVRAAGARLIEVGFNEIVANAGVRRTEAWEYEAAFSDKTAGVVYVYSPTSRPALEDIVERAQKYGLPVLVDAAGELGDRNNLTAIVAKGPDLVAFSGGKHLRGPQSTGILCGRREFISAAAIQMLDMDDYLELWDPPRALINKKTLDGLPRHGIGRALKVSKEEITALLTALDLYASGAYDAEAELHGNKLETIIHKLEGSPVQCEIVQKGSPGGISILEIAIDEATVGKTAFEICRLLRAGKPAVYVGHGKLAESRLVVNPLCFSSGDALIIAEQLLLLLKNKP